MPGRALALAPPLRSLPTVLCSSFTALCAFIDWRDGANVQPDGRRARSMQNGGTSNLNLMCLHFRLPTEDGYLGAGQRIRTLAVHAAPSASRMAPAAGSSRHFGLGLGGWTCVSCAGRTENAASLLVVARLLGWSLVDVEACSELSQMYAPTSDQRPAIFAAGSSVSPGHCLTRGGRTRSSESDCSSRDAAVGASSSGATGA